jgi:hypothetical protein
VVLIKLLNDTILWLFLFAILLHFVCENLRGKVFEMEMMEGDLGMIISLCGSGYTIEGQQTL